ncbi:MAG: glucan biosynthesis protein [Rhodoblastus sp.]|nr:MAG: glucan biosynthesis protein [Rhodoblastus sp.]
MPEFDRRVFVKSAAAGAFLAAAPARARAERGRLRGPASAPDQARFSRETVLALARELARRPYAPPGGDLPAPFSSLTYEQYVGIRGKAGAAIWSDANSPFLIEPLHRGAGAFATSVALFVVEDGAARPIAYDQNAFDFGKLTVAGKLPDLGFSGFRVLRTRPDAAPVEVAMLQGQASYRAVARGQSSGVVARALAIRTAEAKGEEIPIFRSVWIERPAPAGDSLVIHALLDSESVVGAYRMVLRYGDVTVTDVETTLIARVALDHVGVAPMQGTNLFSPLERRRGGEDMRAAVYEVSGLQMHSGAGEWLWRPVANREALQISTFVDQNPKMFGLIQRERDFSRFYDDDQHWELRPSLIVEPLGDWGPGGVQLVEIPAESENNDNIIAYWRPKAGLAQGVETSIAYRQLWCWEPPEPPPLAIATHCRSGRIGAGKRRRFVVEFTGGPIGETSSDIRADLSANPGAIAALRTFISRDRKRMRVVFDIDPPGDASELRLVLAADGKPVSETWLYRWTP